MKLMEFFTSRLAWASTMAVMALVALVSPNTLMGILDRFATDRREEKGKPEQGIKVKISQIEKECQKERRAGR